MFKTTLLLLLLLPHLLFASSKAICGDHDDRIVSFDPKIGKVIKTIDSEIGCTATLIGKSCAITAGHCAHLLRFMEFNVQGRNANGEYPSKNLDDIYEIDQNSIKYKNIDIHDWAVFKLLPNKQTGFFPGDVQGFYQLSTDKPKRRQKIFITGYGLASYSSQERTIQRTHSATIHKVSTLMQTITHYVDTMPGNSGSAIIATETNKIIGIHTNDGCSDREKDNLGTLLYKNFELNLAIKQCLQSSL
jgi:V8-like Glu-specific endopeptidase